MAYKYTPHYHSIFVRSYRTHQESYLTYQKVGTYSTVSQCCSGYVGAPPDCQGKELRVEYTEHLRYITSYLASYLVVVICLLSHV